MNDIIKEFNMISLLGILLPGALLMALFGTEFEVWSRTCDYFGVTMSTGLVSTILIIAGFAFGSLLHELGDLVEKCLWSTRLLNPRTYAAIRSGYAAFYGRKYAEQLKAAAEKETEDEPFTLRTALALALLRHPEDTQPVLSRLTDLDEVTLRLLPAGADVPLMACCLQEGLAGWLRLCAQCTADELLTALTQCAFDPDAATLSALVSRERQAQAQRVYGLQLLWRVLGDERMPDAMGLFDPAHAAGKEAFHG